MSIEINIDEIAIDGPALSRREREDLRAFLEHDLALRLRRPSHGDERRAEGAPSSSPRIRELGRSIAGEIASSLTSSLPTATSGAPDGEPLPPSSVNPSEVSR